MPKATKKSKFRKFKMSLCKDTLAKFAAGVTLPGRNRIDPKALSEDELIEARQASKRNKAKRRQLKRAGKQRRRQLEATGGYSDAEAQFAAGVELPGR